MINMVEHDVKLSNQQIIEFAYMVKEVIEDHMQTKSRLFYEAANCYVSCYCTVLEMLKHVDRQYLELETHKQLVEFYSSPQPISKDFGLLKWKTAESVATG